MIGLGTPFWGSAIFILPENEPIILAEFSIPILIKLVPVIFSLAGAGLGFFFYMNSPTMLFHWKVQSFFGFSFYQFFNRKWYFDKVYNEYLVQPCLNFGYHTSYKSLDRGLIELFGPYGFSSTFYRWSKSFSQFQTGFVYHYSFVMLLSVSLLGIFIIS
jgi:NADH-ubiquinone oxidoreductase chain 5